MSKTKLENLKRKLRQLKHFEEKIRFKGEPQPAGGLVWDRIFDAREIYRGRARFSLEKLASMSPEEYRAAVAEFFAYVYYEVYKESGFNDITASYDPEILSWLGLPYDADAQAIKRRFRELAKKHHPDTGGDAAQFVELMETYRKLIR